MLHFRGKYCKYGQKISLHDQNTEKMVYFVNQGYLLFKVPITEYYFLRIQFFKPR
jgi:hypothetical protein